MVYELSPESLCPLHTKSLVRIYISQDLERKSVMDVRRKTNTKQDNEKKEMEVLKQQFGGGEEGERLAMTVRKLRMAQKEGRAFVRHRPVRDIDTGSESGMSDH